MRVAATLPVRNILAKYDPTAAVPLLPLLGLVLLRVEARTPSAGCAGACALPWSVAMQTLLLAAGSPAGQAGVATLPVRQAITAAWNSLRACNRGRVARP